MSALLSNQPARINSGPNAPASWLQKGYRYGRRETGYFQSYTEEGYAAAVQDSAANLDLAGWNWELEFLEAGMARLTGTAGWPFPNLYSGEQPENIWEMESQDIEKNLLEADFPNISGALELSSASTTTLLGKVQAGSLDGVWWPAGTLGPGFTNVQQFIGTDGNTYLFDSGGPDPVTTNIHLPSADYTPAYTLYKLIKSGVTSFPVEATTITHTYLCSNQFTVSASYNNMNRIISSSSLVSVEGATDLFLFGIPSSPSPSQFIITTGDLQYGWRKVRPKITRLTRIKWRIVQTYQFGLWATALYGAPL